jgi:hypothetical protein
MLGSSEAGDILGSSEVRENLNSRLSWFKEQFRRAFETLPFRYFITVLGRDQDLLDVTFCLPKGCHSKSL